MRLRRGTDAVGTEAGFTGAGKRGKPVFCPVPEMRGTDAQAGRIRRGGDFALEQARSHEQMQREKERSESMKFMEKLCITLSLHNCRYSPYVDEFIKNLVREGKLVSYNRYRAEIKWRGVHYGVWIENYPYADLSDVIQYNDRTILYRDLRPSRVTQIAFWEWMNKQGVYPDKDPTNPEDEKVKSLLTTSQNTLEEYK